MRQRIEVELDDQGRLVLPASLRHILGLMPGMTMVVEQDRADATYLRVQAEQPQLVDKQGVLVVRTEQLDELVDPVRWEREQRVADLLRRVEP